MTAASPQDLVEHGLRASRADDCVVLLSASTQANLRWANNTLTTNGVMQHINATVISFVATAGGIAAGSVTGSAATEDQLAGLVEAADAAARQSSAAEDAAELVSDRHSDDWAEPPVATSIDVFTDFAPALGEAFGRARDGQRLLYGYVEHDITTTYLGSSTGLRLRHVQ